MVEDVWFGLHTAPEGFDFDFMSHLAKEAEKAGLNTFTITDHLMNMANPCARAAQESRRWRSRQDRHTYSCQYTRAYQIVSILKVLIFMF